jgi:imidazole glycerol-phosphate synthase subunit HisF
MLKHRLIAVVIMRDGQVVQSVRFKHTNVIHYDLVHAIEAFNTWSVDEIVLLNVDREAKGREQFRDNLARVSEKCFVPLSAGGWITDEEYGASLLRNGADKLVLNTAIFDDPALVGMLSERFGRQCIVASLDFLTHDDGRRTAAIDRGRRDTGVGPAEAAIHARNAGAGEILFNSIGHDGARRGYDLDTLREVCSAVSLPVIAFGGVLTWDHLVAGIDAGADAVAAANIFHYTEHSTRKAKEALAKAGVAVRQIGFTRLGR